MASIRRRPDRGEGVWQVRVSAKDPATGRYVQLTKTIDAGPPTAKGEPPRKVKELVGILEAQARRARPSGRDTTLGFTLDAYIERCRRLKKAKTVVSYQSLRDAIVADGLAKTAIGRIGAVELNAFDARLAALGRTVTTRAHYFDLISQALNMAVDNDWIEANPVRKMKDQRPRIQLAVIVPPTVEEVRALMERAIADSQFDLASLIFVASSLGARRGELSGLTLGAIDWGRRQVVFRQTVVEAGGVRVEPGTKTKEVRVVSFSADTEAILMAQHARAREHCESVGVPAGADRFLWSMEPDHSQPWRPDSMTHAFGALRDRCGLKHVHLHSLRHMAVTRALEAGVDVKTASVRFGHDPKLMLDRYAHAIAASDQRAAAAAERGLGPGSSRRKRQP